MSLNSQFSFYPPQPDNPSDSDRYSLSHYALAQKGWPEDFSIIMKLMSPPPPVTNYIRPGELKGLKVGIIGGGLAGLAASYELRKLGFDITILEALKDRIGGRVYTYYFDRQKRLYNEFGPMRIPVTHETVWHYINLFKLPTRPFIQFDANSYVYLRKTRARNDPNGYNVMRYIYPKYNLKDWERSTSWQRLLYIGTDSHLLDSSPSGRAEIIQVKPFYQNKTLLWNSKTNINMMESAELSQDAISLVSNFSALLYGNLYNSFIDFIEEGYPADLAYIYEIPGGMVRLPEAFYNSFFDQHPYKDIDQEYLGKVCYKAGCQVNGIHLGSSGTKVKLKYRDLKTGDDLDELFDYVVCAIPFSTLRNINIDPLFSNIKMRAIREVNYTPSQKSLLLCRERFWEKDGMVGGASYTDLPIASIWYPSDHAKYINNPDDIVVQFGNLPSNQPGVLMGSYNFNLDTTRLTNQPEEMYFEEIKREIEMVHGLRPFYLDNIVEGHKTINWNHEPTIRGALSFFSTEQKRIFSYGMTLPEYNGRVFFAGEHISAVHRWMQGSLQSGMQAANDIAQVVRKV
ncbi:MAG TPA: FAD-dependent oxidoreductase [Clostridia bacterium]